MEKLSVSHQTLEEFLNRPFGTTNQDKKIKYESRFLQYKRENRIRIESTILFENHYFIHVKVPSESTKGDIYYDVVVEFYAPNDKVAKELNLENYYVQFFSNSPGFVYKYAALYKMQGYLIESLYDKFDKGVLDILPEKANKDFELFYDSSIYYACRFLLSNKFLHLGKLNIRIFKTKSPREFFDDVQDFESVNISRSASDVTSKIKQEIKEDSKKLTLSQTQKLSKNPLIEKQITKKRKAVQAKKSTFKDSAKESKVVMAKSSSSTKSSIHVNKGSQKKRGKLTTVKQKKT